MDGEYKPEQVKEAIKELVNLRYRLQVAKEHLHHAAQNSEQEQYGDQEFSKHGHRFRVVNLDGGPLGCDICEKPIKNKMIQNPLKEVKPRGFTCNGCKISVHRKCLPQLATTCAAIHMAMTAEYETRICPTKGLSAQGYRCGDCNTDIGFDCMFGEARICDYRGLYSCPECNRLEQLIIPARVIHNWDFRLRPVSRKAHAVLKVMYNRPVINLESTNPLLFNHVEEMREVRRVRENLSSMRKFLERCRFAKDNQLLVADLANRRHIFESTHIYSLADLVDIKQSELLATIIKVRQPRVFSFNINCDAEQISAIRRGYLGLRKFHAGAFRHISEAPQVKNYFHSPTMCGQNVCPDNLFEWLELEIVVPLVLA